MDLSTKVSDAGGIYKKYSSRLEKLGIITFEDFLYHIPFRYDDFSVISQIKDLQEGEVVTVKGRVRDIKNIFTRRYTKIQKAFIDDGTGELEVTWFNQPYLTKSIFKDDSISVSGKIVRNINKLTMISPDFEISDGQENIHTGRLVPVYPETRGISSKWIRKQTSKLLTNLDNIPDYVPNISVKKNNLMELPTALKEAHFPTSMENASDAKRRLSFDELLVIQSATAIRKREWGNKAVKEKLKPFEKEVNLFIENLPFELTNSQKNAVNEIFADLKSEKPMNRLLEGDVGSGKTVVATIAAYLTHLNGLQTTIIAPTEILAMQHLNTLTSLLSNHGIEVAIATSKNKIKTDKFDVLVGTHAILSEKIKFKNLGLVVIDEQQRFGVEQRAILRKKGDNPHLLTMTATPIPRTVALTLYGDLDLTIIDELPKNRLPIKTWLVPEIKRKEGYDWIGKQIKENKTQAFIICPFIEESESMTTVKAAKKEYEYLQKDVFKDLKLALLHGKQKSTERNQILEEFKNGKIDILVATPIVEVGIDIPNATIIVIEASDRFGLAQLHQLRGRVGRGDKQSYCLLFTESKMPKTTQRLQALESIYSGAKLAEIDLKLRGGGEVYGVKQHGSSMLKIADLSDFELISTTRKEAESIINEIDKYPDFLKKVKEKNENEVSPD